MTTYITTCVILFGIDALCKMFLPAADPNTVSSAFGRLLDTAIAIAMFVWGLTLIFK